MTTVKQVTFASLLRRHRRASGLTQEELAERAGLSVNAVSALERGVNVAPRRDTVELLADALRLADAERAIFEAAARGRQSEQMAHSAAASIPPTFGTGMLGQMTFPVVGRAKELALLSRHLNPGVTPPALLLCGEPGIGKSRLLAEAAVMARGSGWSVLSGRCHRRGGQEPYEPLLGALLSFIHYVPSATLRDALDGCSWLVRLLPELAETALISAPRSSLAPDQECRLMVGAVGHFLKNVAGASGTLLLLDDLQWAGTDALDLMAALVRSSGETGVRVIGAYRDTEVRAADALAILLADLAREGMVAQHELERLPAADAQELLRALLQGVDAGGATTDAAQAGGEGAQREPAGDAKAGSEAPPILEYVLQRASGVPFFVVSYAQTIRLDGMDGLGFLGATHLAASQDTGSPKEPAASGDSASRRVAGVPWEVAQGIRQRVAALSEEARDLLGVVAVAGREITPAVLFAATLSKRDEDVLLAGLEAACHGGLLEEVGDEGYVFSHDLIREVVFADLSAGRRALLHRNVAEALEKLSGELAADPVDQLAFHFAHAGDAAKAITYLRRAGEKALAAQANAVAEGYFRELVERLDALGSFGREREAAAAREQLGLALRNQGRHDEALQCFEDAIAICERTGDLERLAWVVGQVGWLHMTRGAPQEALGRIEAALSTFDTAGNTRGLMVLYTTLADLHYTAGQYAQQLVAAERAAELARTEGDTHFLAQAEQLRARALVFLGPPDEGLRVMQNAIRLAEGHADLANMCVGLCMTSLVDWVQGRFTHEREAATRAIEVATRLGEPMLMAFAHVALALPLWYIGEWQAAREELALGSAAVERGEAALPVPYIDTVLGALEVATGALEDGTQHLAQAAAAAEQSGDLLPLRYARSVLGELDLLTGRAQAARVALLPLLDREGQEETYVVPLLPILAWADLELDEPAQAEARLAEAFRRAQARELRLPLVDVHRIQALLLLRSGDWAEAERAVEASLALARDLPYPHAEVKALYVRGQIGSARGAIEQAREHYQTALAICARLGEQLYAERIQRALSALPSDA